MASLVDRLSFWNAGGYLTFLNGVGSKHTYRLRRCRVGHCSRSWLRSNFHMR